MQRIIGLLVFILVASCGSNSTVVTRTVEEKPDRKAKNIILMIGDGMGLTQISAGMYMNNNRLNLEQFTSIGLHKSYSGDNLVTDSAAGATAFASGIKTYNGAIGVNMDSLPVPTILEQAEQLGYATGMVATSQITHATPASFIAHVKSREDYEDIAEYFLKSGIDYFVGGGKKHFDRRKKDERNIAEELRAKGYQISDYFTHELREIQFDSNKNFGYLTADDKPVPVTSGRDYLIEATQKGLEFLKDRSEKGFFLMIEGSQIDWGGHANDSDYIISEMIEFDKAIGKVLEFAQKDGETLVIITADHETGGYAINPGSEMGKLLPAFTSDYHTATLIPVFAMGPGEKLFTGIYENTAIYYKMRSAFGWN